jgi:hypothetical protein
MLHNISYYKTHFKHDLIQIFIQIHFLHLEVGEDVACLFDLGGTTSRV